MAGLEKPSETQRMNIMKPCIINGVDYFSNLTDLLREGGYKNIEDVSVTLEGGKLGKKMKVTFKLDGKSQGFFLDYTKMLNDFLPKGKDFKNSPSHEHVGIMNAIRYYVERNKKILSKVESSTYSQLAELNSDIQSA